MLSVASHIKAPPYFAVTRGPTSHSPPPIAAAPITMPGPSSANQLRIVNTGGSMSELVVQRGIRFEPGWGASKPVSAGTGDFFTFRISWILESLISQHHRLYGDEGQALRRHSAPESEAARSHAFAYYDRHGTP
jgi:hypothetical protein